MSVADWASKSQVFFNLAEVIISVYKKYINASGNGWIRGEFAVKNVATIPLKDVWVNIGIDDNGDLWDGVFVNSNGAPVADPQTIAFGDIPAGEKISKLFWYKVSPSVSQHKVSENFIITIKCIPSFRVDCREYGYVESETNVTTKGN